MQLAPTHDNCHLNRPYQQVFAAPCQHAGTGHPEASRCLCNARRVAHASSIRSVFNAPMPPYFYSYPLPAYAYQPSIALKTPLNSLPVSFATAGYVLAPSTSSIPAGYRPTPIPPERRHSNTPLILGRDSLPSNVRPVTVGTQPTVSIPAVVVQNVSQPLERQVRPIYMAQDRKDDNI